MTDIVISHTTVVGIPAGELVDQTPPTFARDAAHRAERLGILVAQRAAREADRCTHCGCHPDEHGAW
jgi:hypothetical protein